MSRIHINGGFALLALFVTGYSQVGATPVALNPLTASATVEQVASGPFLVAHAVDNNPATRGWAIGQPDGSTLTEIAMFPTVAALSAAGPATLLTFTIAHQDLNPGHTLGLFRLSYTEDAVPTTTSSSVVLAPTSASAVDALTTFTFRIDDSILVGGSDPDTNTYTIQAVASGFTAITGFRLEVIEDNTTSLPTGGPGRHTNGNFVLSDFSVDAVVVPESATIVLSLVGLLTPFLYRRRSATTFCRRKGVRAAL